MSRFALRQLMAGIYFQRRDSSPLFLRVGKKQRLLFDRTAGDGTFLSGSTGCLGVVCLYFARSVLFVQHISKDGCNYAFKAI